MIAIGHWAMRVFIIAEPSRQTRRFRTGFPRRIEI